MIEDFFTPELQNFPGFNTQTWFQQDGTAAHTSNTTMPVVRQLFPNRVISRRGDTPWPLRSPDLSPMDFFLWGYLKTKVYETNPWSIDELTENIRPEMSSITGFTCRAVMENFSHYLQIIRRKFVTRTVWRRAWWLLRSQLSLPRFDLFLQGTLLLITLFHTLTHLMLNIAVEHNRMPKDTVEWVQTGIAVLEVVAAPLVGWWGLRHRPRALAAWLCALAVSGLLLLMTSQPDRQQPVVVLCGNGTATGMESMAQSEEIDDEMPSWVRPTLLVCVMAFCATARLAVWTLGFTYLDDHEPNNGPHFFGILVSIRVSIAVAAESWLSNAAATDPGWWRAQTSISMLLLMFAILFVLFPARMSGYPAIPLPKDAQIPDRPEELIAPASSSRSSKRRPQLFPGLPAACSMFVMITISQSERTSSCPLRSTDIDQVLRHPSDVPRVVWEDSILTTGPDESLARALKAPSAVAQALALALLTAGLWGFVMHEKSYKQARYLSPAAAGWEDHGSSRITGDILRSLVIIFFITSLYSYEGLFNWVSNNIRRRSVQIFRARFSGRRADAVKAGTAAKVAGVLAALAAAVFVALAVLRCGATALEGLQDDLYEQPQCSSHCQCSSETYGLAPVCTLDTLRTYYSPCHAGCRAATHLHTFMLLGECACGATTDGGAALAVRGACAGPECTVPLAVYQVLYVAVLAFSGASLLMQGMGVVRAVPAPHRPVTLGAALAVVALVAYIPGRYLYKFVSDSWCGWHGERTCLVHSPGLGVALPVTSAALTLGSALLCLAAFLLDRRKRLTTFTS
ncbi:Solute carrier organic anion transporter family member 1A1 [Eumeta japonica]|uniref:Solute carrier organic anion transporter family member 1A1 n=1 Tax=Eumeta variegata TaxID=151549 RepID=A0A4C1TAU0_EUMVA|nr:Solute carrier organic anion transporter family member 1A1 [Eumeta japonica]